MRSGAIVASGLIFALLGDGAGAYAVSTDTVVVQDRADAVEGRPTSSASPRRAPSTAASASRSRSPTIGSATLTRPSDPSLALRIRADVLGLPSRVSFTGEATGAGCTRLSCVDLAPDVGAAKMLRLR